MVCIYDRDWQNECKSLSFCGYEWSGGMHAYASREYRVAFKNEAKEKEPGDKMNEEYVKFGNPRSISFNCDNTWYWFDGQVEMIGFSKF